MRKISAWMRSYFAFSHTETRGALLLLLLTLMVLGTAGFLSARMTQTAPLSEQDWRTLDSLVALLDSRGEAAPSTAPTRNKLFPFDPNTTDSATLTHLGLRPWIAQRVINYRRKGGQFRIKADFKKIYGLPDATYQRLYAYLQLPEKRSRPKKNTAVRTPLPSAGKNPSKRKTTATRTLSLDINTADTTQLRLLPGIGSKLSARLVKYRQKLGGYHSKEQLQEIYHLTERGAVSLQKNTYIAEGSPLRRININHAEAKILAQHPYISWDLARALVQHRQDYGEFRSLDDVREVYLMTEKVFEKIAPYLEI